MGCHPLKLWVQDLGQWFEVEFRPVPTGVELRCYEPECMADGITLEEATQSLKVALLKAKGK